VRADDIPARMGWLWRCSARAARPPARMPMRTVTRSSSPASSRAYSGRFTNRDAGIGSLNSPYSPSVFTHAAPWHAAAWFAGYQQGA
jgi:hypothetical protein